jgi:hypothetical protein
MKTAVMFGGRGFNGGVTVTRRRISDTAGITLYRDYLYGNLYAIAIHDVWDRV